MFKMLYFKKDTKKNTWRYRCFTPVYQQSWWYGLQFLRYRAWQTDIGNCVLFFALLTIATFLKKPKKNKNFEKMKKTLRDIIILHMCIITDDDMMHGFLDMEPEDIIFIILAHFLFLYLTGKLKKKPGDFIILHLFTTNNDHMMYGSWDMKHDGIFCYFGLFLLFYPPNKPEDQNLENMKKAACDFIILHTRTVNENPIMYGSWNVERGKHNFLPFLAHF